MSTSHAADVVEWNRELGRAFFQAQDRLRGGPAEELCATEYEAILGGNPPMNRAGHEAFARGFYAGLPDAMHEIDDVFATADRVAVRFIIRGTHSGNFFGIPASGRPVSTAAHVLMHVAHGKVTKLEAIFDEAGLLRQIGVLPA